MHKMRYVRFAVAAAALLAVFFAMQGHVAIGTLCSLCPVGFVQLAAASGSVPWELAPGVFALLAVVFLLGRVFCAWLCPTGALKNLFGGRKPRGVAGRTGECAEQPFGCEADSALSEAALQGVSAAVSVEGFSEGDGDAPRRPRDLPVSELSCSTCGTCAKGKAGSKSNLAAQGVVLAVLLVVSFAVHFPVFCLFCPIGLALGTVYAVSRTFVLWQPGWELAVFPLMLLAEVFLFKRWCASICPLGFFFGLLARLRSKLGFAVAPRVAGDGCRVGDGCRTCGTVCPENIDVASADPRDFEDCTLCLDCVENCPTKSLSVKVAKREKPTG